MASERNRIINIVSYLQTLGIEVNICNNKARGHKGFFRTDKSKYRIDIARGLDEGSICRVLIHEFAHYLHYVNDNTLKSLNFILGEINDEYLEELLALTVNSIPKKDIEILFEKRNFLKNDIKQTSELIKKMYPNLKISDSQNELEVKIKKSNYKYLLKYDKVKIFSGLSFRMISINDIDSSTDIGLYLNLKYKYRLLRRLNSKISKLNRYYNSLTELFARSLEYYIFDYEKMSKIAPNLTKKYNEVVQLQKIGLLNDFLNSVNT